MCFNCLGGNHMIRQCGKKTTCRICKKRHHSLLHPKPNENVQGAKGQQDKPPSNDGSKTGGSGDSPKTENVTACLSTGQHLVQRQVLLATALVNAESRSGDFKVVRALLDQGSQASFVTEDAAQLLRLKRHPARGSISGLGSDKTILSKSMVTILVQSRADPNISLKIQAYVLKSITSYLPNRKVEPTDWLEIKDIPLADPQFNTPNKIDLLLGAEVYSQILREGVKRSPSQTLIAQNTSFGWIVSGLVMSSRKSDQIPRSITVMHTHVFEDDLLRKFWEIEEPSVSLEKMFTEEERRCEELFKATTQRDASGRYVIRLPFRDTEPPCVGGSRDIALKRFKGLERKFKRDTDLKHKYTEVIKEYQQLNHMKPVEKEDKKKEVAVYLPHHAVVREDKTTTKVRVVFDASCKNNKGVSLNDTLMIGPTLQPELRHTILRWRVHPIGLVADIIKMYRQVRVAEEDQSFQRILWRDHLGEEIKDYELLTVTFGTASAPYQAVRALQQVAYDEGDQYLLAKERVLEAFYMDDLLTGCQTVKEGVEVHQQMCELLKKGGFELQKWNSNDKYLLKMITEKEKENESKGQINQEDRSKEEKEIDREIKLDETIKILGLTWELDHDDMKYTVKLPPSTTGPETKRSVISEIARLFDPLGWIAPIVILAKIFIQKLWLSGIGWDEEVPEELLREWKTYHSDLVQLSDCRIPRWLHMRNDDVVVELHGFSDASKMAYAAVVYTRVVSKEGEVHVSLLTAKTKVAPIKQRSIPRLELCGASLLTQLLGEMAAVLKIPKDHVHAWTDSTIVLAWLNKHPSHWKTFVANRVSDILSHLDACQWAHVSTKDNPADCASRGVQPADLAGNTLWFTGPNFLKESTIVYSKPKELKTDLEQSPVKAHVGAVETDSSDQWWSKYSLLRKLLKVVAYCRRFLHYKKDTPRPKHLKMVEIQDALTCCIKKCQSEEFGIEIGELQERNCVKFKDSKIQGQHGFSDASKMAYAAVVYTRVVSKEGEVHVSLLTAKTKVAPIKQRSIPRLELCGASLLTQLLGEMAAVLKIPKDHVHAWTDSTIVLAWLNKHPSHWKTFVANRVSDILSHLDACQWAHVSTKDNPADCASRGVQPADLAGNTLWFTGPNFLKESTIVYSKPKELKTDLEQSPVKAHVGAVETDSSDQWWSKYSLLRKLLKVVAYCRRFLHYKKDTPRPKHLKMVEIQDALTCCIKKCQSEEFGIEIGELQERNCVKFKDSKIKSLTPYLDAKGVLRVGGRLDGAQLDENTKHPIVMPHNSHLTHLLVADAHDKTLHGGPQLMMCYLRTAYWILGVKGLVRQYVRKCVVCAKCRAEVKNQFMGSLPSVRVTPARPFLNTGVDYAGPINIRMTKGRGHKSYKGYICLFVCMVTRAIHLEVVSDMTTQGFIAAFRRFVARRGHCAHIWSDNGTNFVGAAKELKELADIQQSIAENLEIGGTEWHFIPPHSPNFGGLWEAGVKSTKFHIKRVVGDSTLTFEEMTTFLSQVEACLNSRPMMVVNTEDPGEPEPLTPGHFLIGQPLVVVPDTSYGSNNVSTLTRWQMVQKMVQGFWRRWSQEYLTSLLHRYKWAYKTPEPTVGDLVLIKEDDLPPSRWMLGRVVDKHAGSDGITRVVTVKTKGSVVRRPTSKLCILPVND